MVCGVGPDDLSAVLDQAMHQAAGLLSPSNVRSYVSRLPQDVDPVAIERSSPRPVGLCSR